jgi:hypothetical protein
MVDLLPAADNPHICSGKSIVSGLRAVRLTVGDPASSPVSGLKIGKLCGHVYLEIRMSPRK